MKIKKVLIIVILIIILFVISSIIIYSFSDIMFEDKGVPGNKNNDWVAQNESSLKITVDKIGTHIKNNGSKQIGIFTNKFFTDSNVFDWDAYVLEFDLINYNGTVYIENHDGSGHHATKNSTELHLTKNNHITVINTGINQTFYVDGVNKGTFNYDMDHSRVGFVLSNGSSLTYKNLIISKYNY